MLWWVDSFNISNRPITTVSINTVALTATKMRCCQTSLVISSLSLCPSLSLSVSLFHVSLYERASVDHCQRAKCKHDSNVYRRVSSKWSRRPTSILTYGFDDRLFYTRKHVSMLQNAEVRLIIYWSQEVSWNQHKWSGPPACIKEPIIVLPSAECDYNNKAHTFSAVP